MNRSIGGTLDMSALAQLAGLHDNKRMAHFNAMTSEQKADAVRQMAAAGMSDYGVASATGLAVEFVRRLIGEVRE